MTFDSVDSELDKARDETDLMYSYPRVLEKENSERTSFHITHFPPIIVPRFLYPAARLKNSIDRRARRRERETGLG